MTIENEISKYGSIETHRNYKHKLSAASITKTSNYYAAKITTLFLPFVKENVSENNFCKMQESLVKVINECLKKNSN